MKQVTDNYNVDIDALTSSFMEACSNKEFKKFIDGIKLKEEILKNYTSNLEDAFEEFLNCKNCKGKEYCKNKLIGYKYTPIKDKNILTFSYNACKYELSEIKSNEYQNNIKYFDMPKEIMKASFKDIYKDDKGRLPIIKYFKEFMDKYEEPIKPKGMYLTGNFGSGKTYLVSALLNEMAKKGIRCGLIYYPEFLRSLKASFNNEGYDEKFNYIKKVPILLLDDIGAENCSNWSRDEILGPILQYRMESNLPTFFTSNLTIDELEESLSQTLSGVDKVKARRIIERIKQLTIQEKLVSKNRRV